MRFGFLEASSLRARRQSHLSGFRMSRLQVNIVNSPVETGSINPEICHASRERRERLLNGGARLRKHRFHERRIDIALIWRANMIQRGPGIAYLLLTVQDSFVRYG